MTPQSAEMRDYVEQAIQEGLIRQHEYRALCQEIDQLTSSDTDGAITTGSNLNVPVTRAQRRAAIDRLVEAFFGDTPAVQIRNVKGRDERTGADWYKFAREATDLWDYVAREPRAVNAERTVEKAVREGVDYGLGAWKVIPVSDGDYSGPRWFFVSGRDLLFPEGISTDVDELPWIGQTFVQDLAQAPEDWDSEAIERIRTMGDEDLVGRIQQILEAKRGTVSLLRPGTTFRKLFIEFYFTWKDGREYVAVWHPGSGEFLDLRENELARKPFFVGRYDVRDPLSFRGMGVPEDLRAAQRVMNRIYNGALDALRVACKHARLVRGDSTLAELLEDDQTDLITDIGPDFQAITENPEADLRVVPLGDIQAVPQILQMSGDIRNLISELTGIGPAQMGNVGMTRRAPAYGVASVLAEGSHPIRYAIKNFARSFADAVKFSFDLMRRYGDSRRVYQILGDDGEYVQKVLDLDSREAESFVVQADVADPQKTGDMEEQKAMARMQFAMMWHEKFVELIGGLSGAQGLPAEAVDAIAAAVQKTANLVRRAMEAAHDVQDPMNLVVDFEREAAPFFDRLREAALGTPGASGAPGAEPLQGARTEDTSTSE